MGMTRWTESRAAVEHSPQRAKATAWQASNRGAGQARLGRQPLKTKHPRCYTGAWLLKNC